jgi:tetratricopeptide (TPR) repeat protein
MGGVGKSALAVHAAHLVRERFPDGQLYIDLHGHTPGMTPVDPADALAHFLQALGVPPQQVPDDVDMRAACFRDRLADTRTLLVLDNAASTAQVMPLLPGTAGCMVLVTSRRRLAGLGDAHQISLDTLPEEAAVDLLRKAADLVLVGDGYEAAAELVAVCGYLPLAIRIVAARLKHNKALTARFLTAELREEDSRLGRLSDGERELTGVFDSSIKVLPSEGQRLYRLLGLVPGPDFDAYAAANLLATDLHSAERLLRNLFDHNLLLQPTAGRYKFHDLLHAHARSLITMDTRGPEALDKLLDFYVNTAWAADQHLATRLKQSGAAPVQDVGSAPIFPDQDQASMWLRAERPNLLAALSLRELEFARVISLTQALSSHLLYDGLWSLGVELHQRAAALARERGDLQAEANARLESAVIVERQGRLDAAAENASHALDLYRVSNDRLGEAHALSALGQVAYMRSRYADAVALHERALEAYEEVADQLGTARSLWRLGSILAFQGEIASAHDRTGRAMVMYRALGCHREELSCLMSQSITLFALGEFAAVMPTLNRGLALALEYGYPLGVANFQQELATHEIRIGDFDAATRRLDEALQINLDLGFPLGEGYDHLLLGRISLAAGDLDHASRRLSSAYALFQNLNCPYEASALESLARVHHARGELDRAGELLERALALFDGGRSGPAHVQAEVRVAAALVKFDVEGPASALAEYEALMEFAVKGGVPYEYARALEGAARCEFELGRDQSGREHLREAVDWFARMGAAEYASAASRLAAVG